MKDICINGQLKNCILKNSNLSYLEKHNIKVAFKTNNTLRKQVKNNKKSDIHKLNLNSIFKLEKNELLYNYL